MKKTDSDAMLPEFVLENVESAIKSRWQKISLKSGDVFASLKGPHGSVTLEMLDEVRVYNESEFGCYSGSGDFKQWAIENAQKRNILEGANLTIESFCNPVMIYRDARGKYVNFEPFYRRPDSMEDIEVSLLHYYELFTADK